MNGKEKIMYTRDSNFWELGDYKDACLSKLDLPPEICAKISEWWKNPSNFFVFLGNPGCGKSYCIAAIIHGLIERKINKFRYFHEKDFYSSMRRIIEKGWDYEYEIKTICETPWVFMDDIHSGQSTEFQKECLFSFLDIRTTTGYPTIITSNLFLDQLSKVYPERVLSRLKNKRNTVIEMNWIDKRQQ
jgi:DNA replication protein DnaC